MDGMALVMEPTSAIEEASEAERKAGFEYTAQHYLNISGEEFLRRLDAGDLPENDLRVEKVLRRLWLIRPESVIS